jgi:hypothetical protein
MQERPNSQSKVNVFQYLYICILYVTWGINIFQVTSLKRLDSTKRIRKEIWRKRSDFLGIEGSNDDSYLEPGMCMAIIIAYN